MKPARVVKPSIELLAAPDDPRPAPAEQRACHEAVAIDERLSGPLPPGTATVRWMEPVEFEPGRLRAGITFRMARPPHVVLIRVGLGEEETVRTVGHELAHVRGRGHAPVRGSRLGARYGGTTTQEPDGRISIRVVRELPRDTLKRVIVHELHHAHDLHNNPGRYSDDEMEARAVAFAEAVVPDEDEAPRGRKAPALATANGHR